MAKVATKAPAKKAAVKDDGSQILAYNVRSKQKEVMNDAVISKTARGGFMAQGTNDEGQKLTCIMSAANAEKFVKAGLATKDKKTWK